MKDKIFLPKEIKKIIVPPIKCQGIKTKLVSFIAESVLWNGEGIWIEPFLGSGVVAFNIQPDKALLCDTNKHIINFYLDIKSGKIDEYICREYLEEKGQELTKKGQDFYYLIREEFNKDGDSLKFIFLNRSCFNGVMRFNSKGEFNVPFGHKPNRFSKSYITKIVNQIRAVKTLLKNKDWILEVQDWKETLSQFNENDFVYLDPPYIGRHTDYYNNWTENDAIELSRITQSLSCGFALSMWKENKYRKNDYIKKYWNNFEMNTFSHFYYVGSSEKLRNEMIESLLVKKTFFNKTIAKKKTFSSEQLEIF